MTPLNALFESMSGFTATGATAIVDFGAVPNSVFLLRAFAQWVGGIGILVLFIAVFPQLAIAGRQIFHAEMPGPTQDRLTPRLRQTARIVLAVYLALTAVCGVAYVMADMPLFDAVAHAFTTVAAAGFSPSARSFEAYHPAVDWVAVVFMTLAAVNFALLYRAFVGRPRDLWRDPELRAYVTIVAVVGALVVVQVWHLYAPADALRHGLFQVVSVMTTTGYASVDYDQWPDAARALLVTLMAIGGSAGSAAGGVKVARWLIIAQHTSREVRRALHPRAVLPIRVGDRVVGEDVLRAVAAFISLYTALVVFGTLVVALTGEDLITAFTASAATVGNVGPGLGGVGPMASYADLHPVARALMIFNMYAGRLEIVTVFVVATGSWWRLPRFLRRDRRRASDARRAPADGRAGGPDVAAHSGRGRTAPYVVGTVFTATGIALVVFAVAALIGREPAVGFAVGAAVSIVLGIALRRVGRAGAPGARLGEPTRREALVALLSAWALVPALGAIPYLDAAGLGPLDAYFESMSGFTTTGATVLTDFGRVGPVAFLYRAFTQWVGGVGIIVLFVGLFPQLAIAGRQLFFAEAPGPTEERLTPRLRYTATAILGVYAFLTAAIAVGYAVAGMSEYDAIAHALTTVSAGGFSPEGRSFEGFGPAAAWVAVVGMAFAGANFALLYRGASGRWGAIARDAELRTYLTIAAVASVATALLPHGTYAGADAWRHGAFQALSILTSTGYASADFALWPERSQAILLVVAFIGGSAGSAAGGVKVARWLILTQHTAREVRRTLHPRAVLPVRMGAASYRRTCSGRWPRSSPSTSHCSRSRR